MPSPYETIKTLANKALDEVEDPEKRIKELMGYITLEAGANRDRVEAAMKFAYSAGRMEMIGITMRCLSVVGMEFERMQERLMAEGPLLDEMRMSAMVELAALGVEVDAGTYTDFCVQKLSGAQN